MTKMILFTFAILLALPFQQAKAESLYFVVRHAVQDAISTLDTLKVATRDFGGETNTDIQLTAKYGKVPKLNEFATVGSSVHTVVVGERFFLRSALVRNAKGAETMITEIGSLRVLSEGQLKAYDDVLTSEVSKARKNGFIIDEVHIGQDVAALINDGKGRASFRILKSPSDKKAADFYTSLLTELLSVHNL
jgi:hypothetical protein